MIKEEFPPSPVGHLDQAYDEPIDILHEAREALRIKVLNASQRIEHFDNRKPNQCLAAWRDGSNMTPEFDYFVNGKDDVVQLAPSERDEFLERLWKLEQEYLGVKEDV